MDPDLFSEEAMLAMDLSARPAQHPFTEHIHHFGVVVPPAEARALFDALLVDAHWKRHSLRLRDQREVEMPRDIAWYGVDRDHARYTQHPQPWPPALLRAKALVEELTGHVYNGCLCNLYKDGSNSVAWHSDHEAERGAVASLSLGATRVFRVRSKQHHAITFDFQLPNGSLLLMKPGCQLATEHTVPKTKKAVGPRLNLTFRQVGLSSADRTRT